MSTDDENRLPPLDAAVNGQDRSSLALSHAGHHVMAKTRSARRHRQGPEAARMRGRSEATSLARCRAQIEHQGVMVGESDAVQMVALMRAPKRATVVTARMPRTNRVITRGTSASS